MDKSYVRVLGSADWHQTAYNDHSCYTIDDRILIDACPSVVTQLQEHGVDPVDIPVVCFTHMHADHIMGLAPLIHYWRVRHDGTKDLSGYTIIGPKATLKAAFDHMLLFVFGSFEHAAECIHQLPRLVELEGDCEIDLPEYHIRVMNADHAVPGLCYCITSKANGRTVGLTGDTAFQPEYPAFFAGCDMLLHEASFGGGPVTEEANRRCRHSSAQEAAKICKEGKVRKLLLTHAYEPKREAALAEARSQLDIPVQWAVPHNTYPY